MAVDVDAIDAASFRRWDGRRTLLAFVFFDATVGTDRTEGKCVSHTTADLP
jgi:hypothetical protein